MSTVIALCVGKKLAQKHSKITAIHLSLYSCCEDFELAAYFLSSLIYATVRPHHFRSCAEGLFELVKIILLNFYYNEPVSRFVCLAKQDFHQCFHLLNLISRASLS